MSYRLFHYTQAHGLPGRRGSLIEEATTMQSAARHAADIVAGRRGVSEEGLGGLGYYCPQVLMELEDGTVRLYDHRWRNARYKYKITCGMNDCQNPEGPWMNETTPNKGSTRCEHCWNRNGSEKSAAFLAEYNRSENPKGARRKRELIAA